MATKKEAKMGHTKAASTAASNRVLLVAMPGVTYACAACGQGVRRGVMVRDGAHLFCTTGCAA